MKAIIEFNLPEEQSEYKMHVKASDYYCAVHEFTNIVRAKAKYADPATTTWEDVRQLWWDTLNDYKVDPYED